VSTGPQGGQASIASIAIHAPAEAVWALVTDITRTGEWSPESNRWRVAGRRDGSPRRCPVPRFEPPGPDEVDHDV
jgi:uncharacterized protein YndB with AHSA1/START domain